MAGAPKDALYLRVRYDLIPLGGIRIQRRRLTLALLGWAVGVFARTLPASGLQRTRRRHRRRSHDAAGGLVLMPLLGLVGVAVTG
jgi:hypothetical protein